MKTLPVGELKAKFSKILEEIKNGEEYAISFGRSKEKIAVILPYSKYKKNIHRRLGILEKKASFNIPGDFKVSDEDILAL